MKGSVLRRCGELCRVDSKNVVIVIIEDIIANVTSMAVSQLMYVIVRFVIGLDCRVE